MKKRVVIFLLYFLIIFTLSLKANIYNEMIKVPEIVGEGNTGLSFGEGLNGLFFNPASLSGFSYNELSITYTSLYSVSDIRYNTAGYYFGDKGDGGIAIGIVSSGLSTSISYNSDSFFQNYNENIILFGYGFNLYNLVDIGIKIKTFMATSTATALGWGIDMGILYNIYNIGRIGLVINNIGNSEIKWSTGNLDTYQTKYSTSILLIPIPGIKVGMDINSFTDSSTVTFNTGIEIWLIKKIAIRSGIYRNMNKDYIYTVGGSLVYNNIFFTYGIEFFNEISPSHSIGIDYKF